MLERFKSRLPPRNTVRVVGAALMILGTIGAIANANNVTHQPSKAELPQQENLENTAEKDNGRIWITLTLAGGFAYVASGGFGNPMREEEANPALSSPSESPQPNLKS